MPQSSRPRLRSGTYCWTTSTRFRRDLIWSTVSSDRGRGIAVTKYANERANWLWDPPPALRATSPSKWGRQRGGVFRFLRRFAPPPPASGGGKEVVSSGSSGASRHLPQQVGEAKRWCLPVPPALRATSPSKWGRNAPPSPPYRAAE